MAKAWRNIKVNNGKRPLNLPAVKHSGNWLLNGLMVHAGYLKPAVPQHNVELPYSEGFLKRMVRKLLKWRS